MKGIVLGYNEKNKSGHISINDDKRLSFSIENYLGDGNPSPGAEVDFIIKNDEAIDIYPTLKNNAAINIDNKNTIKNLYYAYLVGAVIPFVTIVALFFSYSYKNQSNKEEVLHSEYQIKTFWLWLLYSIVAIVLLAQERYGAVLGLPGIALLIYAFIFYIKRNIKGIMAIKNSTNLDNNFMDMPSLILKEFNRHKKILPSKKTKVRKKRGLILDYLIVAFVVLLFIIAVNS